MKKDIRSCFATLAIVGGVTTSPVFAQSANQVEEIVVTATRRTETIQDAPVSVTALDTRALESIGADGFDDFVRRVPGLAYNEAGGRPHFVIRGLASENSNVNQQGTVTLYVNDLPQVDTYAPLGTTDLTLFDIERVEVLRGPQGTLFGSGSIGGAIRVITNKPKLDRFEGKVEMDASSVEDGGDGFGAKGMLNVPIGGKLALRVVGTHIERPGVVDQPLRGVEDADKVVSQGGRAALLFQATDDLAVTASVSYQDSKPEDTPMINATLPLGAPPTGDAYSSTGLVAEYVRDRTTISNVTVDWDLGFASLFSSTSYADKLALRVNDVSYLASAFSADFTGEPFPIAENSHFQTHAFSQELRLTSNGDGPLSWLVGAFYIDRNRKPIQLDWLVPGAEVGNPGLTLGNTDYIILVDYHFKQQERALFGEVAYEFNDRWKLAVGGRAFENEDDRRYLINWAFGDGGNPHIRSSESGFTPRVVLSYEPVDSLHFYMSATEGYRVGGPNEQRPGRPLTYGPDSVWAYELGAKTSWFDNRLVVNTALFYNDWDDIQVSVLRLGTNSTENAGKAHTRGVELEVLAAPIERLQLSVALAYVDARSDTTNPGIDPARGGISDGDRLPGSPRFTSSEAVRYTWPAAIAGGDFYVDLAHRYIGEAQNGFNAGNPWVVQYGDWNQFDAKLGWARDRYELVLSVDNASNEDAVTNVIDTGGGTADIARLRPRTVGLTGRVSF